MKLESGPFSGYDMDFAPDQLIKLYPNQVDRILGIMGYPRAMVTDWSAINDFPNPEILANDLNDQLGIPVKSTDLIVNVAEFLWITDYIESGELN